MSEGIKSAAVIGSGVMGSAIAAHFAKSGFNLKTVFKDWAVTEF